METNLIRELNSVLKLFPEFWQGETLLRSKVIDALKAKEPKLIKALIGSEKIKQNYSTDIDGVLIFDFDKLIGLLRFKEYWPDSFTKYRNKIGLTSAGKYLDYDTDVVLSFPFKDCVLEGGMTKEEQGKDEVYYNEIIARDEIDRLFSPKVFTNSKRYSKDGVEENITEFKDDDNLIIKGNNLIALHSLKQRFAGKVKLIYIDPPYNTGNDSFKYNDRFNRSTWLTFMKNRLEVSRDLLSYDGFIFIQCDDYQSSYLKILCDNIYGFENYRNSIYWHRTYAGKTVSKKLPWNTDTIHLFSKNPSSLLKPYTAELTLADIKSYRQDDDDGRGKYNTVSLQKTSSPGPQTTYDYVDNQGKVWPCPIKGWRMTQKKLKNLENQGRLKITETSIREKYYLDEQMEKGKQIDNFWGDIGNLNRESDSSYIEGQKTEKLIKRIIELSTQENDLILDFCLGSGTTAAVAHKMGRRYIGIEQMDYINDITVPRLQKVIGGEQGGISKDVKWQGGGSFVYTELKQLNATFIQAINAASGYDELVKLFVTMKAKAHLNYQVELDKVLTAEYEVPGIDHKLGFKDLILDEQKRLLIELLDKNQLYVNVSEMDDATLDISENDKTFTKSFYGEVL